MTAERRDDGRRGGQERDALHERSALRAFGLGWAFRFRSRNGRLQAHVDAAAASGATAFVAITAGKAAALAIRCRRTRRLASWVTPAGIFGSTLGDCLPIYAPLHPRRVTFTAG
ncbi:MAG: hypothetical protein U1E45_05600 [Geminicoccaceae bacterium]